MKVKNYYDTEYGKYLAKKIKSVYPDFYDSEFISLIEPTLESLEFNDRQILLALTIVIIMRDMRNTKRKNYKMF